MTALLGEAIKAVRPALISLLTAGVTAKAAKPSQEEMQAAAAAEDSDTRHGARPIHRGCSDLTPPSARRRCSLARPLRTTRLAAAYNTPRVAARFFRWPGVSTGVISCHAVDRATGRSRVKRPCGRPFRPSDAARRSVGVVVTMNSAPRSLARSLSCSPRWRHASPRPPDRPLRPLADVQVAAGVAGTGRDASRRPPAQAAPRPARPHPLPHRLRSVLLIRSPPVASPAHSQSSVVSPPPV